MFIWNSCLAGSVHHSHRYNCIEASCVCVFLHHSHSREGISNVFIHCYLSFHWIHLSKPPYAQCALNYNTMMNIHTEEIRRMKKNLCNDFLSFHFLFFCHHWIVLDAFQLLGQRVSNFYYVLFVFDFFALFKRVLRIAFCHLENLMVYLQKTKKEKENGKWRKRKHIEDYYLKSSIIYWIVYFATVSSFKW